MRGLSCLLIFGIVQVISGGSASQEVKMNDTQSFSFRPQFEKHVTVPRDGRLVRRVAKISESDVEEIIRSLSLEKELMSIMIEYSLEFRSGSGITEPDRDIELRRNFLTRIRDFLEQKGGDFPLFEEEIAEWIFQKVERGELESPE